MTELSFLLDLLLHHKLSQKTKDVIAERIKVVEVNMTIAPQLPRMSVSNVNLPYVPNPVIAGAKQSPSTMALLAKHPDLVQQMEASSGKPIEVSLPPPPEPPPVAVIAQTPQTAAALAARNAAIAASISGKPEKGRTSPRKF